jgi:C4-dicarboxylate-specific signal transduction histidine kinase
MELGISEFHDETERHFTGLVRDVTERKEAERRLRERHLELAHVQRLSTSGELAAGVAHQLNQPLTAVANDLEASTSLLRRRNGDAQIIELLDHAMAQVMHAGGVLDHLRQFIRKREPAFVAADLREVVAGALTLLRSDLEREGVAAELNLGSQPLLVRVDTILIEQLIVNLVQNAVEALAESTHGQKRLQIRAAARGTESVELTITDSGRGIGQAKDHLFEPFFTTKTDGLGMGLVISRSIAEAHDGEVSVSSRPDGKPGAVARLVLPLRSEPRPQEGAAKTPARKHSR